jgi:hypothetical protein
LCAARLHSTRRIVDQLHNGLELRFETHLTINAPGAFSACIAIKREGELAFIANTYHDKNRFIFDQAGSYLATFVIPPYILNPGRHVLGFYFADARGAHEHHVKEEELLTFDIEDDDYRRGGVFSSAWPGAVCPVLKVDAMPCPDNYSWTTDNKQTEL